VRNQDQYLIWINQTKGLLQNLELTQQNIKSKIRHGLTLKSQQAKEEKLTQNF